MQGRPETRPTRLDPNTQPVRPPRPPRRQPPPVALAGGVIVLLFAFGFALFSCLWQPEPPPAAPPTDTPVVAAYATPTPVEPEAPPTTDQPTPTPGEDADPSPIPPADTPIPGASLDTSVMSSPDYGLQVFLYWRPEVADRDLKLVEDIGFRWVKQEFAWREIEGAGKGIFNWDNADRMMDQIEAHNLKVIARLGVQPAWAGGGFPEVGPPDNYQDFADFAYAVASRYKGRIEAYQVWNEPNLSREWGDRPPNPAEYTELLRITYEAIKRADPSAIVISAGLAPTTRHDAVAMPDMIFVQGMYDAGARPYFDALGVHGAGYRAPPEMDPVEVGRDPNYFNPGDLAAGVPEELRRIYCFRHVENLREIMVRNGDADKRVVVLEFGWTVDPRPDSPYFWHAVSEQQQAEYIVRAFQYAKANWQPWIGVMVLIYIPNADWTEDDEQTYWSIVHPVYPELRARPAYWALMDMPK